MAEIKVPDLGESISEGTLHKWLVKVGDTVSQGDLLAELETDKVNLEISAEESGVIGSILRGEGENVTIGEIIAIIETGSRLSASDINSAAPAPVPAPAVDNGVYHASPAARRLAREKGIDLNDVSTRDPIGRVQHDDVQANEARPAATRPTAPTSGTASGAARPIERQRMSRRRQTIATHLVEAQQTAAMLTTFNEVDMTSILDLRKRHKDAFKEKHEVSLGFMSFFTKAVVGALKAYPLLNAEIDGHDILVKKFYDIGIAVAAKAGLVVPVVRDADRLSFAEIERSIGELASKARSNSLVPSDLQGGSFTITNGGVFGSLLSTPILNAPQVGILGMHKIQLRPVAIDEVRAENRPMMYIALSYDHRIVDGAEAVGFLVKVKEMLEDPETLLLEG